MSAALISFLYVCFPLVCVLAIPQRSGVGAAAERFVYGVALYQFLLLVIGLTLGLTHHLTTPAYLAFFVGAAALLLVRSLRSGGHPHFRFPVRCVRTRRGAATLLLAALVAVSYALELGFDALCGTRHGDGLWYHIPRAIFWSQQHSFEAWTTPVAASIGLPVGADLVLLHRILLGQGWQGSGWVTFLLTVGATACVYLAALDLRLPKWHAAIAALLFAGFPAIGLRIWSVNSDMAAAFPALAAYVAIRRIRDPRTGLAVFLVLNGMAIACKPTVLPLALLLAAVALWQCRHKLVNLRTVVWPCLAALSAVGLVVASYWPVYLAFSDFLGGDYSRAHRSASVTEFLHAVAMHFCHWLLEPLGYLPRFKDGWGVELVRTVYNAFGAGFASLPNTWKPYPGQDSGCTGLAPVLALPLLLTGFRWKTRRALILLLLLGFVPLSGMINPQPYHARYLPILLAGFALLWGGSKLFRQGRRRWLLASIAAINAGALLGVVVINIYLHETRWSQPGGAFYYLSDNDRNMIANALAGRSLLVITESSLELSSMDALLVGPEIAFPLSYVVCPANGDWARELRMASGRSNWLALVHNGRQTIIPGPEFPQPGGHTCSRVPRQLLEEALAAAGWRLYRSNEIVDLWEKP